MVSVLQIGSRDVSSVFGRETGEYITFSDPTPTSAVNDLSSETVGDVDCIVVTLPSSDNGDSVSDIATVLSEKSTQPVIVVAPTESVKIDRLLATDAHFIPYLGTDQTHRLVESELVLAGGEVERIDPGAEWRMSPTSMAHISQTISEAFSSSFETATKFALTISAGHLGYEMGHATMNTERGIEVISDREAYAYDGVRNYTDLPTSDLLSEIYKRERGVVISTSDSSEADLSDITIATPGSEEDPVFETTDSEDPIYVDSVTPPTGVNSYIGVPVEHNGAIVGELSLASVNEYSLSRLQYHINHLRAIVKLVETIYAETKTRENLQEQVDHLENFSQIVAHDLQNPVNIIDGRLKILNEGLGIENDHIDEARTAIDRIENIVDDTLQYAKNGGAVQETVSINIPSVVADCWEMVDSQCAVIDVVDRFSIQGDIGRVNHLFENLLCNAVTHTDATEDDPVHIRIGATNVFPTTTRSNFSGRLGFYFEDDGPGIPEDKRDELLELGETTAEDGTGMGLAIVNEVAAAHGWEMKITESHSGGTRFEFTNVLGSEEHDSADTTPTIER